jgi:cytochrome c biogenesis protein CcdA
VLGKLLPLRAEVERSGCAFALGTTVPLLRFAGLLAAGIAGAGPNLTGARRGETWLRLAGGGVLVLAGLNDTANYWLL